MQTQDGKFLRFVIVGAGYISRVHLAALTKIPDAKAMAIVARVREKGEQTAREYGIPAVYTDWKDAFASDNIDAALICLPHQLHHACAIAALNAGKHVLIEKPLCITSEEADDMIETAEKKSLILMVAHMKRFDKRFTAMKEEIDGGRLGRIFMVKTEWIGPKEIFANIPWAAKAGNGGGPFMGFGSHHIDLLQWMVGPIKDISCRCNNIVWPQAGVEDSVVGTLTFENGAIGSIIYTWGAQIYGQHECLAVHGTRGSLSLENEDLFFTSEEVHGDRKPRKIDTARSDQRNIEQFGKELALSSLEPFVLETKHFVECVRTGATPVMDGREARKVVDLIVRGYRSAKTQAKNQTT